MKNRIQQNLHFLRKSKHALLFIQTIPQLICRLFKSASPYNNCRTLEIQRNTKKLHTNQKPSPNNSYMQWNRFQNSGIYKQRSNSNTFFLTFCYDNHKKMAQVRPRNCIKRVVNTYSWKVPFNHSHLPLSELRARQPLLGTSSFPLNDSYLPFWGKLEMLPQYVSHYKKISNPREANADIGTMHTS